MRHITVSLLASLALCLLFACSSPPKTDPTAAAKDTQPVNVQSAPVERRALPEWLYLTGSLVASQQGQIAADSNGVVTRLYVDRGDRVERGAALAEVDSATTRLSAAAGRAQAEAVAAQLAAAEQECARSERLFTERAISQAQLDRARATCAAQRSSLEAARAQAELARTGLGRTLIRAPRAGTVGERLVEVGAFVQPATPIVSLYAEGLLRARFAVPEAWAGRVSEGQAVEVEPVGLPGRSLTGRVRTLAPALREQTRDRVVEAELDPAEGALPGMSGLVRLSLGDQPQWAVPEAALTGEPARVYVVREGRAFELVVEEGSKRDGYVAIRRDLQEGDRVVLSPSGLRDGQQVIEGASASAAGIAQPAQGAQAGQAGGQE